MPRCLVNVKEAKGKDLVALVCEVQGGARGVISKKSGGREESRQIRKTFTLALFGNVSVAWRLWEVASEACRVTYEDFRQ